MVRRIGKTRAHTLKIKARVRARGARGQEIRERAERDRLVLGESQEHSERPGMVFPGQGRVRPEEVSDTDAVGVAAQRGLPPERGDRRAAPGASHDEGACFYRALRLIFFREIVAR